jgi:lipoprotein-anchoring transpeptidase ErfK/SrfK
LKGAHLARGDGVPLNQVWLPYASDFNGGIAFQAYPEVPAHPASHGCVRLPVAEAPFAYGLISTGARVTVN